MDLQTYRERTRRRDLATAEILGLDPARVVDNGFIFRSARTGLVVEWTEYDPDRPKFERLIQREMPLSAEQVEAIHAIGDGS